MQRAFRLCCSALLGIVDLYDFSNDLVPKLAAL